MLCCGWYRMWYDKDLNAINIVSWKRMSNQHFNTAKDVLALAFHTITEVKEWDKYLKNLISLLYFEYGHCPSCSFRPFYLLFIFFVDGWEIYIFSQLSFFFPVSFIYYFLLEFFHAISISPLREEYFVCVDVWVYERE